MLKMCFIKKEYFIHGHKTGSNTIQFYQLARVVLINSCKLF